MTRKLSPGGTQLGLFGLGPETLTLKGQVPLHEQDALRYHARGEDATQPKLPGTPRPSWGTRPQRAPAARCDGSGHVAMGTHCYVCGRRTEVQDCKIVAHAVEE